jgi:excisionase family DNA binding protein
MQNVHFTPPQLAPLFGVNVSTIKRWVDRGLLQSDLTSGKHRRISQQQLMEFIKNNPKHSKNSYVLRRLLNKDDDISNELWQEYYQKLLANNSAGAEKIFDRLFLKGFAVIKILETIVMPALRHIGKQWENKKISVYEEHRMSFLIRMHLMKLDQFLPAVIKNNAPLAIMACAPGEHHELPLQLSALVLKKQGWKTDILGIDINMPELIKAAEKSKPGMIVMSKTYTKEKSDNFFSTIVNFANRNNICLLLGGVAWDGEIRKISKKNQSCIRYFKSLSEFHSYLSQK